MWADEYDINTTQLSLKDAHVVLTGTHEGHPFVLEGDVDSVSVQSKSRHDRYFDSRIIKDAAEYRLNFKPDSNGVAYTIKTRPVRVERTARVQATDRTVESIENARVVAGAPSNAKFRYSNIMRDDEGLQIKPWDAPRPVDVEFYWVDHA